ncbi:heparinase II/III family protein [Mesorhizobium sp. ZC-5]|uniref:heparinase II/III family protein n=1 Tax=Mesorhizobium sp. ZC-5 TaxID=2986066 RepID=UPI0021E96C28|nr:heparinase II/III family protein [Mesorhizobium sp. ZC-5]MCV3243670.1 heparinase II/III family protein [Mesorhizobium sp. ZC-5]
MMRRFNVLERPLRVRTSARRSRLKATRTGDIHRMRKILPNISRLLRTVRHLRSRQITNRIVRRLAPAPHVGGGIPALRSPSARWQPCRGRPQSLLSAERFRFLALEAELAASRGWNDATLPKLWLYNLHYFDDLLAEGATEREGWHRALIDRWIAENPPTEGNGWEPYTLSRRIMNWVCSALSGFPLSEQARASLAVQARALNGTLEYHLLGNHLFANAKALIFVGAFFEGAEAERWLQRGLAILEREIPEQVLADGGHFELSPMYHALILEDMIDLLQLEAIYPSLLADASQRQRWRECIGMMLDWLAAMTHPDGEIALFNDAAFGQARRFADLAVYAANFGIAGTREAPRFAALKDSGYIRIGAGPWVAFFDVAKIGPDYIPGHAHADTLSVEMSFDGIRLVTNGGTSTYALGPLREEERATFNHATVEIDSVSSSEVWASFRVGRRARSSGLKVSELTDGGEAEASHDGYRFLPGRPTHRRSLSILPERVTIRDRVDGHGRHELVGRFPLHPSVRQAKTSDTGWRIETASGRTIVATVKGPVQHRIEEGHFAPEFGSRQIRPVLTWRASAPLPIDVTVDFEP